MSPHSRSRSITPRRSYSRSPSRRNRRHKSYSQHHSNHPPSPPPPPPAGRYSDDSKSSSRSTTPRNRSHSRTSRTRSRSRSRSRSGSRSYTHDKRYGNRDKPQPSRCIGVFGMSVYTTQQKIREIFSKFGPIERIQVVIDAQTGRSRGFCFIYYEDIADAKVAKEACSGLEIDGRRIRVAYSITQRPHTPTPGVYMGRATGRPQRSSQRDEESRSSRRRSSSRTHNSNRYQGDRRRRHERSRSRSYSPRRSRY